jgi:hypothetical protein
LEWHSSAQREAWKARPESADLERAIQALPASFPWPPRACSRRRKFVDQGLGTVEQQQILIRDKIVMPIAQSHVLVALGRQVRQGMAQGIDQAQADDVPRPFVAGRVDAEVGRRRLDAGDDGAGRIHQRAVPVEDDQFKALAHIPFSRFVRVF